MQSVFKLIPVLILLTIIVSHLMEKPKEKPTIKISANQTHVIKMYAITTAPSKIHYKAENCQIEFHDVYGNVITELPANFSGEIHLFINCSKRGSLEIWLDNGTIYPIESI